MAIREEVVVEIATVEVNDEYRVELAQLKKVTDYSPDQARDLANELVNVADAAEEAIRMEMDQRLNRMEGATIRTVDGEVVL